MATLPWIACGALVAFESALLLLLTIPSYYVVRAKTIPIFRQLMRPLLAIVPFGLFQLIDVYWKYEHRMSCEGRLCSPGERDRFEKSAIKNQRNFLLAIGSLLLYWLMYRFVAVHTHVLRMEEEIKKLKSE